jgi:hypothetical protein
LCDTGSLSQRLLDRVSQLKTRRGKPIQRLLGTAASACLF